MNPGAIEEGVKGVAESLRGYPTLVTLIVFQIVMMAAVAWAVHERGVTEAERFKLIIERCSPRVGGSGELRPSDGHTALADSAA